MTNTELKHTPGEWSFFQVTDGPYKGQIAIQHKRHLEGGKRLTTFVAEALITAGRTEEALANARLISAAPDLLEALKDQMATTARLAKSLGWSGTQVSEALAKAQSAINKATS